MADYATLLREHVTLTCRSVDRIFLQGYVPKLQTVGWVCQFLRWQRGFKTPSSAAFGCLGEAYVAAVHRFAEDNGVPVVHFVKGENKEQIARPLIEAAERQGGGGRVVLIGVAQERALVWRLRDAQAADARPAPDVATVAAVTRPSTTDDGQHVPGPRFEDPRVMAVLAAPCGVHSPDPRLRQPHPDPAGQRPPRRRLHPRHATYDLRRPRRKQLIERIPGSHRHLLTPPGRRAAVPFTETHDASRQPASPHSTPTYRPTSPPAARWPPPGANPSAR